MTPLQDSAAHLLGATNGSTAQDASRELHKIRLLNTLWTWNAFVKEWRSVRVPVGAQLMKDVSTTAASDARSLTLAAAGRQSAVAHARLPRDLDGARPESG